jgi:hypothetical protein
VILPRIAVYQDVVQIHDANNVYKTCQGLVDVSLEGCRCIRESERYYRILIVPVSRAKSSLLGVFFSNRNAMIRILEIQLRESSCLTESIDNLTHKGKCVSVLAERNGVPKNHACPIYLAPGALYEVHAPTENFRRDIFEISSVGYGALGLMSTDVRKS